MTHRKQILRLTSIVAAMTMMLSVMAPAVEAAVTTLLAPQAGEKISGRNVEVAVGYNTQSDLKITELQLWIDGQRLASKVLVDPVSRGVSSFWWDASKVSSGVHNIAVKVYAGDRLLGTVRTTAAAGKDASDLKPPAAHFSNVESGQTFTGKTRIKIESSDDSGNAPVVSLLVDNTLKMLSNTRPCSYELDTTQYSDGQHELHLIAFDSSGNKTDAAVIKVAFKNNLQQTAVALPKMDAQPKKVAASEVDYAPKIPPVESASQRTATTAARTEPDKRTPAPAAAKPVAAKPKPAVKPDALLKMASVPAPFPRELPPVKTLAPVVKVQPVKVAQTKTVALAAKPQAPKRQAFKPFVVPKPQPNPPPRVSIPRPATAVPMPSMELAPAKAAAALGSASEPMKSIQMAAVSTDDVVPTRPAVVRQTPVSKDVRAKPDNKSVPASGKVKLRDLVRDLGGVLSWDAANHVVVAYLPEIKLEMEIGSQLIKVNGEEMGVENPPVLLKGRTVIDVDIYHLARHIASLRSHDASDS